MKSLKACKVAKMVGSEDLYWDVFDKLQEALFTHNKNIDDDNVIYELIKETDLDFDKWLEVYNSEEVIVEVETDLYLAKQYNIKSVPALIIDQKYILKGAQPYEVILESLTEIYNKKFK